MLWEVAKAPAINNCPLLQLSSTEGPNREARRETMRSQSRVPPQLFPSLGLEQSLGELREGSSCW